MAFEYKNTPVLAKVKIGEQTYWLKDAELRAIVDEFKNSVNYNVSTANIGEEAANGNLATIGAFKAYLEEKIAGLSGAMHFVGVKEELPTTGKAGDIVIVGTAEYVNDGEKWILIGDEGVYATKTGVATDYVAKVTTIAGIDLQDSITVAELQEALGLKALAYKDSASGSYETVTSIDNIAYTPAGNVSVASDKVATDIESTGKFTPAGNVTGKNTAAGTVSIARDENGIAVSGTISTPTITVTPTTTSVVSGVNNDGVLPSLTDATYVDPTLSTGDSAFATNGVIAAIDADDAEMLVFTAATTAKAITSATLNAGSFTQGTFNAGNFPTFATANVLNGASAALDNAPVFTGDKFGATFTGTETNISAEFTGSEGNISVAGKYNETTVGAATFTGTEATLEHKINKGTATVTVQ